MFHNSDENMRDQIFSSIPVTSRGCIVGVQFLLNQTSKRIHYRPGQVMDENFFFNAHHIFNLNLKHSEKNELNVSYLLPTDHGLNLTTRLYAIGFKTKMLLYSTNLMSNLMQQKVVVNPSPRRFLRPSNPLESNACDLRCQESDEDFKLTIVLREVKLLGMFFSLSYIIIF